MILICPSFSCAPQTYYSRENAEVTVVFNIFNCQLHNQNDYPIKWILYQLTVEGLLDYSMKII